MITSGMSRVWPSVGGLRLSMCRLPVQMLSGIVDQTTGLSCGKSAEVAVKVPWSYRAAHGNSSITIRASLPCSNTTIIASLGEPMHIAMVAYNVPLHICSFPQLFDWWSPPSHWAPPFWGGGLVQERIRDCCPQADVHWLHSVHSENPPSTANSNAHVIFHGNS